jgi:DNA-binding GntR family transcriptional regulator
MPAAKQPAKRPARKRAVKPPTPPNRSAVIATLAQLEADPATDARAQLALTLADALDAGAGMATAAISKELRATLREIEEGGAGDDDFDRFIAGLSSPVDDAKN